MAVECTNECQPPDGVMELLKIPRKLALSLAAISLIKRRTRPVISARKFDQLSY